MDLTPRLGKVGKCTNTAIERIIDADIVIATEIEKSIFKGKKILGNASKHTTGWENIYFEFHEHNKPCSSSNKKEVLII